MIWHGAFRHLHSFPTRRSSDLLKLPISTIAPAPGAQAASSPSARNSLSPDRKSTRLNSSHANISYAVFCLKKKKIDHTRVPFAKSTIQIAKNGVPEPVNECCLS